jgi:hypothetical protein
LSGGKRALFYDRSSLRRLNRYTRGFFMLTFAFYVDDDRYTVPTLKLEICENENEALARAHTVLGQSHHYRGVEVCLDGKRVFGIGSYVNSEGP